MSTVTKTILSNLIFNKEYFGKVIPFIKPEYFPKGPYRTTFNIIFKHFKEHNEAPSQTAVLVGLDKKHDVGQKEYDLTKELISSFRQVPESHKWLMETTEQFCKERAIDNAITEIIAIKENFELPVEERDRRIKDIGAIPDIMKAALSVGFTIDLGHDYNNSAEMRWDSYTTRAKKIPFMTHILNWITKGGVERKTLNLLMAGVNVGKSLGLCHLASEYLLMGHDVLYVSMEMAEEVVGKRIDANLMDISLEDLDEAANGAMTKREYLRKFERVIKKGIGRLYVKQFPTGGASTIHIANLLDELAIKKDFHPTVVIVDYLGIMASSRIRHSENSYTLVKSIAEELRGLAVERNVVIWSAAQTTRSAWDNTDVSMGDIAESAGLAATADFILAISEDEDLASIGQQLCKQIKSRYGDKNKNNKFTIIVEKDKQRWSDLDSTKPYNIYVPEQNNEADAPEEQENLPEPTIPIEPKSEKKSEEKKGLFTKGKSMSHIADIDIDDDPWSGF